MRLEKSKRCFLLSKSVSFLSMKIGIKKLKKDEEWNECRSEWTMENALKKYKTQNIFNYQHDVFHQEAQVFEVY